jgi:hypothetical protein
MIQPFLSFLSNKLFRVHSTAFFPARQARSERFKRSFQLFGLLICERNVLRIIPGIAYEFRNRSGIARGKCKHGSPWQKFSAVYRVAVFLNCKVIPN